MDIYNNTYIDNAGVTVALELIKQAIQEERKDELFYDYLLSIAPAEEEKQIIITIISDERRHNALFRKLYKDFTGQYIESLDYIGFNKPKDYLVGVEQALFGELKCVERYREIRKGLPSADYRDILLDIITDELKHANKYNYIYTTNKNLVLMHEINRIKIKESIIPKPTLDEIKNRIKPLINESKEEIKETILISALVGAGYSHIQAQDMVGKLENDKEIN